MRIPGAGHPAQAAWPLAFRALPLALLVALSVPASLYADEARTQLDWRAQIQSQLHLAPAFDDPATAGDEAAGERMTGWRLRRLRVSLEAKRGPWKSRVKLALDGGGSSWAMVGLPASQGESNPKAARLLSGWLQRDLPAGLRLRLGQFKRRLSQDYLVSSSDLRFVERSISSDGVGSKRDVGLMLQGAWWRKRIRVALLALNGNGANSLRNDNDNLRLEARIDVDPLGRMNLGKAKIGRKPKLRFGAAVARARTNEPYPQANGYIMREFNEDMAMSAHFAAVWQGVELRAEGFWRWTSPIDAEDPQRLELGYSDAAHQQALDAYYRNRRGWYVQVAWRLPWQRDLELVARGQQWWPDHQKPQEGKEAVDVGLSWRLDGDRVKVQTGWLALREHRQDQPTMDSWLWITQLQLTY